MIGTCTRVQGCKGTKTKGLKGQKAKGEEGDGTKGKFAKLFGSNKREMGNGKREKDTNVEHLARRALRICCRAFT